MRIKCFNRQDKSTSIYYIYVLKHMHRNHAKIQTKRVPKLSSPLDGFFKLLASNYKIQPSYPTPRKLVPLELVPQTVYIHAVKLLSYSFALCFTGGGGIVFKGKCEHLHPTFENILHMDHKPKQFYINKNIFIEDQTT